MVIDGDFLTADLASRDGRTKHYRMQYINENRVRLVEAELCEPKLLMQEAARNLKCFHPRLQDVEFYMQRCAD